MALGFYCYFISIQHASAKEKRQCISEINARRKKATHCVFGWGSWFKICIQKKMKPNRNMGTHHKCGQKKSKTMRNEMKSGWNWTSAKPSNKSKSSLRFANGCARYWQGKSATIGLWRCTFFSTHFKHVEQHFSLQSSFARSINFAEILFHTCDFFFFLLLLCRTILSEPLAHRRE